MREHLPRAGVSLHVDLIDPSLDVRGVMWGEPSGAWLPDGLEWAATLAAAGVPTHFGRDCGKGLLLCPNPGLVECEGGRRVVTGPPPARTPERLDVIREALGALVRPDLRGVLVLRLDDPGAAVSQYLESWRHSDVSAEGWSRLWATVKQMGRLSIFCCPGWVDPDGHIVESRQRRPDVWRELERAVSNGFADLECHGYTHIHPNTSKWVSASDRLTSEAWYRELAPPNEAAEPSVPEQVAILNRWQDACGPGTTLVAPGEAWGLNTVVAARIAGFRLFTSWELCRLDTPVPLWTRGVISPYLDQPSIGAFSEGLPVVGYWHDRDMALNGPEWVPAQLSRWRDVGATRAWAFGDLARAYATPIEAELTQGEITIRRRPDCDLLVERA